MPFKSDSQRRYMFSQHPRIAKRWAKHTPNMKALPEKKMKKTAAEIAQEVLIKQGTDGKGNPINTLTTTRPAERSSLYTTTRATTARAIPETKPISDGTEDGAFGGVTKISLAQKVAEHLLTQRAQDNTN